MQEVNIGVRFWAFGKGRPAGSKKDKEVEGALIQFDGDPGRVFVPWAKLQDVLNLWKDMHTPADGSGRREAPRA